MRGAVRGAVHERRLRACCDGPYHVYEQRQARGGVLSYFCSNRERPAAALVTPEGSAYRALTKVATQM